jgi:peptidyl-prolyl cis-trans isomerase B (cyclophilin B)
LPLLLKVEKVGAYKVDEASGNGYYTGDGLPVQTIEIKSVTVR